MGAGETFEKEELIYQGGCKHKKKIVWLSGNVFWGVA